MSGFGSDSSIINLGGLPGGISVNTLADLPASAGSFSFAIVRTGAGSGVYSWDEAAWVLIAEISSGGTVSGSGTADTIVKFTAANVIGDSVLKELAGALVASGSFTAVAIIKSGGTAAQILLADGTTLAVSSLQPTITVLPVVNGGTGQSSYTNGQILIGITAANTLVKGTITGTANQITITNGAGSITVSLSSNVTISGSFNSAAGTFSASARALKGRFGDVTNAAVKELDVIGVALITDGATNNPSSTVQLGNGTTEAVKVIIAQAITGGANIVMQGSANTGGNAASPAVFFADSNIVYAAIRGTVTATGAAATGYISLLTTPNNGTTALAERVRVAGNGDFTVFNLAGAGNRMVESDANGVQSATKIVTSGTYTPTLTIVSNVTNPQPDGFFYTRIGDIVTVTGRVTWTQVAPGPGSIGISLPIASNFATVSDLRGSGGSESYLNVSSSVLAADSANDRAALGFTNLLSSPNTAASDFTFMYKILP